MVKKFESLKNLQQIWKQCFLNSEEIQIIIRLTNAKEITLDLHPLTTVEKIKQSIQDLEGLLLLEFSSK